MIDFILFVIIFFIIIKLSKYLKLTKKLSERISLLENRLSRFEQPEIAEEKMVEKPESPVVTPGVDTKQPVITAPVKTAPPQKQPAKKRSEFWKKLEKQLVENWTGMLGAIIMVMGVGFIGIYAALKFSPFFRFLMIVSFAAILGGLFYYLKSKLQWLKLALWFRSSAGAIFLFSCFGAGNIEGLQWIENQMPALLFLSGGILVNLYLGYAGGKQIFASLHLLLSLIILAIAPQSDITFIAATIVSIFGIVLTYREKWDYHLLLSISSFFLYHLFWYFKIGYSELTGTQNLIGIITVITISVAAALVHYREAYQTKKFAVLPFSVHLVNWFYFGLGLLLHTTGTQWKTIAILLGAIAAYFLARKARKIGIRWLYYTDTLIAQLIAIIAIITFTSWDVNALVIMGIMFLQTILFLIVMIKENEEKLYRIGTYIMQFMGIIFISSAFILINLVDNNQIYNNALILFISITVGTVFHIYSLKKYRPRFNTIDFFIKANGSSSYSILAILIGFMVIALYLILSEIPWIEYYVTLPAIILVYLRQRYQSNGLGAGIIILLIGLHIIIWDEISLSGSMSIFEKSAHAFPFLLLSFSTINWSYVDSIKKHIKWPGIYFFALHTGIITYYMFNPVSPLIPGVVYLILSLFALELANFLRNKYSSEIEFRGEPDRYLLQIGYFLIFVFLFRHVLIHLQVESYISVFKTRFLIELFAIGIFAYWAASKKPERDKIYKSWTFLHPLFMELIILFSIIIVSLEINEFWHPIIWIDFAFLFLYLGARFPEKISRLRFYSLVFYWITAFQVAFLTSGYVTPSMNWFEHAWLSGSIVILSQFVFVYYLYHQGKLKGVQFPKSLKSLQSINTFAITHKNQFIFYPLIACVAIFFYWSFDKSVLTLFWVIECFMIFILSIVLRENHLRYIALGGIGISIVRLMFYDLSQSTTITKALIFLAVGIILLMIHSAYNKYKDRFTNE